MSKKRREEDAENRDVAQLFFDSFSKRVGAVEDGLRNVASGFERLKLSVERGQISDLVLLERLQKAEQLIKASLESIKVAVERNYLARARLSLRESCLLLERSGPYHPLRHLPNCRF